MPTIFDTGLVRLAPNFLDWRVLYGTVILSIGELEEFVCPWPVDAYLDYYGDSTRICSRPTEIKD